MLIKTKPKTSLEIIYEFKLNLKYFQKHHRSRQQLSSRYANMNGINCFYLVFVELSLTARSFISSTI